jgi:hypothetical protein
MEQPLVIVAPDRLSAGIEIDSDTDSIALARAVVGLVEEGFRVVRLVGIIHGQGSPMAESFRIELVIPATAS